VCFDQHQVILSGAAIPQTHRNKRFSFIYGRRVTHITQVFIQIPAVAVTKRQKATQHMEHYANETKIPKDDKHAIVTTVIQENSTNVRLPPKVNNHYNITFLFGFGTELSKLSALLLLTPMSKSSCVSRSTDVGSTEPMTSFNAMKTRSKFPPDKTK
jgi:hypothetical protein